MRVSDLQGKIIRLRYIECMSAKDGSSPRLDRIERMIDALTQSHGRPALGVAASDTRFERKMAKSAERHNRRMAGIRAETAAGRPRAPSIERQSTAKRADSAPAYEGGPRWLSKMTAVVERDTARSKCI